MNKVVVAARILLGLPFLVFGSNYFFEFLPMQEHSGPGGDFLDALASTGYMLPVVSSVQMVSGLMLVLGAFVPLGLVVLAPIVVNILCFHLYLESQGLWIAAAVSFLWLFCILAYRGRLKALLNSKLE